MGLGPGALHVKATLLGCQNQSGYRPGQSHGSACRVHPGQTAGAVVGIVWRQPQGDCLVIPTAEAEAVPLWAAWGSPWS